MKKSRSTDSQIIEVTNRVETGLAQPELCCKLGISSATFYKSRSQYGGMDVSPMVRRRRGPRPRGGTRCTSR
ncbi:MULTISPECIES: transposase [Burkholderiales]|uniref:transposase n=1 Tax=Burkholderiales TaxID=80840 RepID=UPI00100DAC99